jgi:hypothetical protein
MKAISTPEEKALVDRVFQEITVGKFQDIGDNLLRNAKEQGLIDPGGERKFLRQYAQYYVMHMDEIERKRFPADGMFRYVNDGRDQG